MPFLTGGPQLGAWLVVLAGNCKGRGKGSIINIMGCPMFELVHRKRHRSSRSWEAPDKDSPGRGVRTRTVCFKRIDERYFNANTCCSGVHSSKFTRSSGCCTRGLRYRVPGLVIEPWRVTPT